MSYRRVVSNRNASNSNSNSQLVQFNADVDPNRQFTNSPMAYKSCLAKEEGGEQKIPLFLVKLWNIVEDPAYWEAIRWDETGMSFHIMDPGMFCKKVLPYFFKHANMSSLVRQLNMYGFRKNTPIERTGLAHAESDQDHLEFFHPFFRRDHPHLLASIKRKVKVATRTAAGAIQPLPHAGPGDGVQPPLDTVAIQTKDLSNIFDELKLLRDRQQTMEMRMEELTKENEMLWTEMAHVRGTHLKQQQIVNKLIQFLVALVAPAAAGSAAGKHPQQRLGKRHITSGGTRSPLATKSSPQCAGAAPQSSGGGATTTAQTLSALQSILPANASEILDRLINEIATSGGLGAGAAGNYGLGDIRIPGARMDHRGTSSRRHTNANNRNNNQQLQPYLGGGPMLRQSRADSSPLGSASSGPIIAEVTEEMDAAALGADCGIGADGVVYQQQMIEQPPMHYQQQQNNNYAVTNSPPMGVQQQSLPQGVGQKYYAKKGNLTAGTVPIYQQQQPNRMPMAPQQQIRNQPMYHQQQLQQPLVVYQPAPPSHTPMPQQIVVNNGGGTMAPQQHFQQQPQTSRLPQHLVVLQPRNAAQMGNGANAQLAPPLQQQFIAKQQQQPMPDQQQIAPMQQIGASANNPLVVQPHSIETQQQSPTLGTPMGMEMPLTEGMLLNESEMAEIAGLNAYLDENGERFHQLTNSIGEHWVDATAAAEDGGLAEEDEFGELFEESPVEVDAAGTGLLGGGPRDQRQFVGDNRAL